MQSQVLKFLLKENKFNSQAQGIKVIFLPTPPPFAQWLFSRSVRKQHNVFEDKEIPKMPLVMWCMYFVYIQQFGRVGFFLGGGGGLCLRFPIWMLSCFLMWSDGIAHMDEGGGGGQRGGNKAPSSQETAHYIPIHWACSCKILILAFKYNPVEWKTLWWCLLILFDNGREKKW